METTVFFSNRSQAVRLPKAVAEKYGGFHYLPPYVDMSCVYPLWD